MMGTENHVSQEPQSDLLAKTFSDELYSVTSSPPPISVPKMDNIKKAAMEAIKHFKIVVYTLEKFISSCQSQYKLPAFHVMDAIIRQSVYLHRERDVYVARFSKNLTHTFEKAMSGSNQRDRQSLFKIVRKWKSKEVFPGSTLKPLYKIASKFDAMKSNSQNQGTTQKSQTRKKDIISLRSNGDHRPPIVIKEENPATEIAHHTHNSNRSSTSTANLEVRPLPHEIRPVDRATPPQLIRGNNANYNQLSHDNQHHQCISGAMSSGFSMPFSDRAEHETTVNTQTAIAAAPATQDSILASSSALGFNLGATPPKIIDISDRERRCLPPIKAKHLTVCSSTLWVGRLPKGVQVSDISDVFGMFGAITSINLVSTMGCVYVCMDRRQDAHRIISQRDNIRLIKSRVNIAWSPGAGFQKIAKFKDFWHADIGASYIPHIEIDESIDLDALEVGGVIDDETLTPIMRCRRQGNSKSKRSPEPTTLRSNLIPPAFLLQNQTQQQILNPFASVAYQGLVNTTPAPLPSPLAAPINNMQSHAQLAQLASLFPFANHNPLPQGLQQGIPIADLQQLNSLHQAQGALSAHPILSGQYLNATSILQNQHNISLNSNAQQIPGASNVLPMEVIAYLRTAQPQGQTKPYP